MSSVLTAPPSATFREANTLVTTGPDLTSHPEYFRARQQVAWDAFQQLPMPVRTDEAWRFADVKSLQISQFVAAETLTAAEQADLIEHSHGLPEISGRMIFANDRLVKRTVLDEGLRAKGVLWLTIEEAIAEQRPLIEKHFMREAALLGSRKFSELHASQVHAGMLLYVPRNVEIELPLETFHWLKGENGSVFPHTLIVADDHAKVTVVDHFASRGEAAGFVVGVNDIYVGNGARVNYVAQQDWNRKTVAFHLNNTVVQRDASALALQVNFGGARVRTEAVSHLRQPGGRSDMLSVSSVEGSQVVDQRTLQIHEQPNTASDLLYKNALNDQAHTIFTGLIRVDEGAHQTDAYQKVRNLLLSEEAEANSAPGLEIEADDVRCTHGATSGALEAEELFYLQSRGIPQRMAQKLITFGFLSEVFERLPDKAVRAFLTEQLQGRIG